MSELFEKLSAYGASDCYPYHMPGHKRRLKTDTMRELAQIDITEIDGFDNLHDAQGILKRIQEEAAATYGAEESFFLVNGSTAGILSAISTAVSPGGKILMVRGAHKSAYHAAYLRDLQIAYLWPGVHPLFGCNLPATAKEVEEALQQTPDVQAVFIVSPTYEGLAADVKSIAEAAHKRNIPLIVDEAHGAHLGFDGRWPESSVRQGADLVIQSLHKTLPAPTQTAILHVNRKLVDRCRLRRFLGIYQTSSPSYIFMAAMEDAIATTSANREKLFGDFWEYWKGMTESLSACQNLIFLKEENSDPGKLAVMDKTGFLDGEQLYEMLLHKYHLQPEMAAGRYVLAMFTVGDTKEGYERLTKALLEIDEYITAERKQRTQEKLMESNDLSAGVHGTADAATQPTERGRIAATATQPAEGNRMADAVTPVCIQKKTQAVIGIGRAWDTPKEWVLLKDAEGKTAGEYVNLYPPGSPIIVPGEIFTKDILTEIAAYRQQGFHVQGVKEIEDDIYVSTIV
ncbi:MAG: aminotransferase class I/II-fold pyridoxal phosphate-dependent enzyme [Clostridium sp.]|nr:aminotransferase class I/II-fold pyridoxal phosphate-dependent enzyme [Clostridium sp.]MDD6178654.1 aminotransferase class I/II-fold pyridoxal phosphate-dependent enzyme [Clostridium sp.]